MATWRIQLHDGETELETDELVRGIRSGRVGPGVMVMGEQHEGWVRLSTVPELAACLRRDPWAAWDDPEEVDPSSLWSESEPRVETPAAVDAAQKAAAPQVLSASTPAPEPSASPPQPTAAEPLTEVGAPAPEPKWREAPPLPRKVIVFPRGRIAHSSDGALALDGAPRLDVAPEPWIAEAAEAPPSVRWWLVVTVLALAIVGLTLYKWAYTAEATAVFADPVRNSDSRDAAEVAAMREAQRKERQAAGLKALEAQLRDSLAPGLHSVSSADDLEVAMLIELRQVGLDVRSVTTKVNSTLPNDSTVPEHVDVQVTLNSDNEQFDRELGGVALVVGKYIARHQLEVDVFDVTFHHPPDGDRARAVNPTLAKDFFLEERTLEEFLAN